MTSKTFLTVKIAGYRILRVRLQRWLAAMMMRLRDQA